MTLAALSLFPAPLSFPMATLEPSALETNKVTTRLINAVLDPIADLEFDPPP